MSTSWAWSSWYLYGSCPIFTADGITKGWASQSRLPCFRVPEKLWEVENHIWPIQSGANKADTSKSHIGPLGIPTPKIPEPLGHPVHVYVFVDANHAGNFATQRLHTGIFNVCKTHPVLLAESTTEHSVDLNRRTWMCCSLRCPWPNSSDAL